MPKTSSLSGREDASARRERHSYRVNQCGCYFGLDNVGEGQIICNLLANLLAEMIGGHYDKLIVYNVSSVKVDIRNSISCIVMY